MYKITTNWQICLIISSNYLPFVCKTEQYKHNQNHCENICFGAVKLACKRSERKQIALTIRHIRDFQQRFFKHPKTQ